MGWISQGTDNETGLPLWFNTDTGEIKYGQSGSKLNPDAYDANGTMIATGWNPNMAFPTEQGGYSVRQVSSAYLASGGDPNDAAAFERYMRASYPLYKGSLDPDAIIPPSAMPESAPEGLAHLALLMPAIGGIMSGAMSGAFNPATFSGTFDPTLPAQFSGTFDPTISAGADGAAGLNGGGPGVTASGGSTVADGGSMDMWGSANVPGNPSAGTVFSAYNPLSGLSNMSMSDLMKIAGPASNIIGGLMGANAAKNAAEIQSGATDRAINAQTAATMAGIEELRRQSLQAREDSLPWLQTGAKAIGTLGNLTGVGGDALNSPLLRKFTVQDFYNDPVTALSMQFGLDQGQRGIENMARARGGLNSGGTLKELTRFGTDYAGQQAGASRGRFIEDQTNAFNKLANISGIGQTAAQNITGSGNSAASSIASMNQNSGNTTASLLSGLGNARGAASIAGSNAMSNAFGSLGNWYTQSRLLDALEKRNP